MIAVQNRTGGSLGALLGTGTDGMILGFTALFGGIFDGQFEKVIG